MAEAEAKAEATAAAKRALAGSLEEARIGYTHLKALGTPKAGRLAGRARR